MTRKEKSKQIQGELDRHAIYYNEALVEFILTELEAGGMQWDPEKSELPEAICWRLVDGVAIVRSLPKHGPSQPLTPAAATEVFRRYEAWPKLRKLVDEHVEAATSGNRVSCSLFCESILALLDGKEGA